MKQNHTLILLAGLICLALVTLVSPQQGLLSSLSGLVALLACAGLIWLLYQKIKGDPQAFSKAALSQSLNTLTWLSFILMAVIYATVKMLQYQGR